MNCPWVGLGQFTPGIHPETIHPRYILPFTIDLVIITRGEFSLGRTIYPGYSDVSDKVRGELPLGRTVYPRYSDVSAGPRLYDGRLFVGTLPNYDYTLK